MKTSEAVWREYHSRLQAFVRKRVPDGAAADDILQDLFLRLHAGLTSLKDEAKLSGWLYQIARNSIIDYHRSQKPTLLIPEEFPEPIGDPGKKALEELSECLRPMIRLLPEMYREAVILSELKGLPQREVARAQGTSLSGAKSRVQRGRVLLKKMLTTCCELEFDQRGQLCGYERKDGSCDRC